MIGYVYEMQVEGGGWVLCHSEASPAPRPDIRGIRAVDRAVAAGADRQAAAEAMLPQGRTWASLTPTERLWLVRRSDKAKATAERPGRP